MNTSKAIADALSISANNTRLRLENYMDEKYHQAALDQLKAILNDAKQQFFNENDKVNLGLVKKTNRYSQKRDIFFTRRDEREK